MDPRTQQLLGEVDGKVDQLLRILEGKADSGGLLGGGGGGFEMTLDAEPTSFHPNEDLTRLLDSIAGIHGCLEEEKLCNEICAGAIRITRAQRAFLMVLEDGSKLRWKAGFGITQDRLMSQDFGGSRSIIKDVVTNGNAILRGVGDAPVSDSMQGVKLQSALGVPIPCGERLRRSNSQRNVAGLIYVDSRGMASVLEERHRDLLLAFARQVSLALENCWLFAGH